MPAGISFAESEVHTRSVFHKSRKGFISLLVKRSVGADIIRPQINRRGWMDKREAEGCLPYGVRRLSNFTIISFYVNLRPKRVKLRDFYSLHQFYNPDGFSSRFALRQITAQVTVLFVRRLSGYAVFSGNMPKRLFYFFKERRARILFISL